MKREYIKKKLKESFGRTLNDELMEKGLVQQQELIQDYVDEHKKKPKKQSRVNNKIRRRM